MQMLHKNEQLRRRDRLLSLRLSSSSGINWTPRPSDSARRDSSSKENDDGGGGAASLLALSRTNAGGNVNAPRLTFSPHKQSQRGSRRKSTSALSTGRNRNLSAAKKIYINSDTMRAIEIEVVENLTLPASLAAICLALKVSESVMEAHLDASYSRLNDDNASMKQFEITGSLFDNMSLSPSQERDGRRDAFRSACMSLLAGGNGVMLNTWEEVKKELSDIFEFTMVDIKYVSEDDSQQQQHGNIPTLSRRHHHQQSTPKKMTPKRAHRRLSPKKSRRNDNNKITPQTLLAATKKVNKSFLSMDDFKEEMKRKMGPLLYKRLFRQAEIVSSKPALDADAEAARLDEQIKEKEAQLRSKLRQDEIIAAKEKADKEREAQESASRLLRPLTSDERKIVTSATKGIGPEDEILSRHDADSVQRGSMQTLRRGQWLNDEVINYFLKNCLAKRDEMLCAKQPGRKRSHFFNSFFVQTMFDEKNNNPKLRGKFNYKNVKRWSKKVPGKDIFNLNYIVCPINLDNIHWTSAVIFMEQKRIQYYDSMGGTDHSKLEGLLQYLKDEHRIKKGSELNVDEWELVACTRDTPRQRNGFDCGVFTCMFCDFISKDCPLVFTQDHIDQCRERIALSIMKNCAVE